MKRRIWFVGFALLVLNNLFCQTEVTGRVYDAELQEPLPFVHVLTGHEQDGSTTDETGQFSISTDLDKGSLTFKAIGFQTQSILFKAKGKPTDLGIVYLQPEVFLLDEVTISSGLVKEGETPVTVSTVTARTIQKELGDRPLPLSFNNVPGVYSVRNGGGSGDAEMSIRGFDQQNVGILLNGIPINGVENGLVYWSNWLGLSQVAAEIQIQKGPGFTNAAVNAVGGSVNIVTEPAKNEQGGSISYQLTNYGNQKMSLVLNSGKLKNGWSISAMGSFIKGPGYIDATYVEGWSYYLALSKKLNSNNKISLTLLGAPQFHGQRTLKLTNEEHSYHGNFFNKDWGSMNGKINNASENFYHRPFLGINHYLKIDDTKKITTSLYLIVGTGGGKWSEGFNYSPTIFHYRNTAEQIDWPSIYENNATHKGEYVLADGDTVSGYSLNVQTNFLASHVETGLMSSYEQRFNSSLKLVTGFHYRFFNSLLREEITDLLGGQFYIDDYAWAVDGVAGRQEIRTVGDIIKVNNNSIINFINAYTQLIYDNDPLNAYVSVTANNNWYQRIDSYNYVGNTKSEVISKPGMDVRAGIGYNPSIQHTIYANAAFISKAPYFKYVFGNFTNVPVINLKNEQISTVELGYRFENRTVKANLNGFYTLWNNVSMLSDEYVQLESNLQTRAMINGLNAIHKGIEIEFNAQIDRIFSLGGFLLLADYRWKNNVSARLFNNENIVVDTINVFVENIFVGGTAQQQFGLFANLRILSFFNIKAEWQLSTKTYAGFNPTFRNNPNDTSQPFRFPSFNTLNIYLGIPFKLFKTTGLIQVNGYNILNSQHIEWGEDGINHDLNTFQGFWSFGRTFDFTLKLNF